MATKKMGRPRVAEVQERNKHIIEYYHTHKISYRALAKIYHLSNVMVRAIILGIPTRKKGIDITKK